MKASFDIPERFRVRRGPYATQPGDHFGAFFFEPRQNTRIFCIVDDGALSGWEHVSVSVSYSNRHGKKITRIPTWDEMCYVKDPFWTPEETVIQFHPSAAHYVNNHPSVLHLWKRIGEEHELPNHMLVGFTGDSEKDEAALKALEPMLKEGGGEL